jgi:hypothetical protein
MLLGLPDTASYLLRESASLLYELRDRASEPERAKRGFIELD